jgi:hypothetical protein
MPALRKTEHLHAHRQDTETESSIPPAPYFFSGFANQAYIEGQRDDNTGALAEPVDFLSNGFKLRSSFWSDNGGTGNTYIYAAFAENPFKYANAR